MPDTTLTSAELDELERLAKAATPGPWFQTGAPWFRDGSGVLAGSPDGNVAYLIADTDDFGLPRDEYEGFPLGDKEDDAAYIASANPATILRLLSLARAGLEAGKAEESMRERAATVADQLRMVATPGENALFGQGMANAADQIATAIRALPPVTATAKWADPAYIERLERGDHLDSGFLDAIRALPLTTEGGGN